MLPIWWSLWWGGVDSSVLRSSCLVYADLKFFRWGWGWGEVRVRWGEVRWGEGEGEGEGEMLYLAAPTVFNPSYTTHPPHHFEPPPFMRRAILHVVFYLYNGNVWKTVVNLPFHDPQLVACMEPPPGQVLDPHRSLLSAHFCPYGVVWLAAPLIWITHVLMWSSGSGSLSMWCSTFDLYTFTFDLYIIHLIWAAWIESRNSKDTGSTLAAHTGTPHTSLSIVYDLHTRVCEGGGQHLSQVWETCGCEKGVG